MKKPLQIFIFFFTICFLSSTYCFSQIDPYWNGWIDFSQKYYKIPIAQNGVYRLDSASLANAGIPVTSINPKNFQLFFRGKEQYIYIKGEADGVLNSSDYIEFYGKKNDGELDTMLYKGDLYDQPVRQPNPYYSLFNDTSAYFLTWNNSFSNNRIVDVPDTNYIAYSLTGYFMKEDIIENHTNYYYGRRTTTNIPFPEYHESEGWSGTGFYQGSSYTATFNTSNLYSAAQDSVEVKLAVIGANNDTHATPNHNWEMKYKSISGNYVVFDDTAFDGYRLVDKKYKFPASSFGISSATGIMVTALPWAFSSLNTVPYVVLKYPHNQYLESKSYYELFVPDNTTQPKTIFSFTGVNDMGAKVYLYDFTSHTRVPAKKVGNSYKVVVANSTAGSEKFCTIKSENNYLVPSAIVPIHGNGTFTNYLSLAADSAYIIITNKSLWSGANAYANYRAGILGGSHNTLMVDMDELYDQFAWGIPKHPFAIRHFAAFCLDKFPTEPQDLFLIGKSIQPDLCRNIYSDPNGTNYNNSLVPSIGYPPCDNMLVDGINGNKLKPAIPIGRLAATDNVEVATYLNKVNEYEHPLPDPDEWMKHVIHMAGGNTSSLTTALAAYEHEWETIIEDTSFGGYVHSFQKNSSSPTQISYSDSIRDLINHGVSIIAFFGHSSASVFDFNLLPPDQYSNTNGKYPFFCAIGCYAGDIHQPIVGGISSSEIFTLSPKGTIAFLASSGPSTIYESSEVTKYLYKNIGQLNYGKPIGKCIQEAIGAVEGTATDPYMNAACLEMTLHGDPAIVIHANKLPDFAVNHSSVFFNPSYVSTDLATFDVNVVVANIGKATNDSVVVSIKRTFVDGTSVSYSDTVPSIHYKDTLTFRLPVDPVRGPGLNKFEVRVDPFYKVTELDENNNNLVAPNDEVSLMIYSGDIIPVYPYKYAIIPNNTVTLKAYTANPFAPSAKYIFEIDTTDLFNSPLFLKTQVTAPQIGAVVKMPSNGWPSPLVLQDSMVYFWRVMRDTTDTINFKWRESSFQYISNKSGAGQSHFFQFLKGDRYKYVNPLRPRRYFDLEYQSSTLEVQALNYTASGGGNNFALTFVHLDGNPISTSSYLSIWNPGNVPPHVLISVVDPVTGAFWVNNGNGPYGSYAFSRFEHRFEFYTSTPAQQEILRRFLQDTIPCGSKVIISAADNHNLGDILSGNSPNTNPGLVQALQSVGGTQFTNIHNNLPYILIGRKCGTAIEKIGNADTSKIFLSDSVRIKRESGYIYSENFGPASLWKSLHWNFRSPEAISNPAMAALDTIKISVIGIKNNGDTAMLMNNISKDSLDIYNLDNIINASIYPYVRLQAWVKDSLLRTPDQLKYWRLYFDGVPEAALNPVKQYSFYNSSVQQGDSIKMKIAVENIGDYNMDSLWVNFWVIDANRNIAIKDSVKMKPLLIDSIVVPSVKFSTATITGGLNSLWVEANPYNTQHQAEQYHFNNIGTIPFNVATDKINPLLDVTFDGVHIMNGDIVSAKPSILIKLKDENTFLALNDPSDFDVHIKRPGHTTYDTISFGNNMIFEPAALPNNSCKIKYTPALPDGIYYLKVKAKDRSGNNSGNVEYTISFEVINKPTVTNVLNYPNPFSTSTKFVFTLTGSEVPDYFKIQILTVSGKIVRDLSKYDLGPIHIGRNITEYAWDGKDEYGDQLANGLYLYRIITQLDGKSLEHRESAADPYFTQGYGKMYLIH